MIGEATTKVLNYPDNEYLSIDDLNDAIAAILDAALNKWGEELVNKGLAGITPGDYSNQFNLSDSYAYNEGQGQSNIP